MVFGDINLQKINYDNLSSLIVIIVLLSFVTLLLVYMILNVNNKMNNFMKIYDDEQDKQEKDLENTFKKINKSNKNLKILVDSKKIDLERDDEILSNLGSRISENEQGLNRDNQLIDNLHNVSFSRNDDNTGVNIGSNNQMTLGDDGTIQINLEDEKNFKLCNQNGENCSRIISRNFVDERLPIIPSGSS
jgi:predicted RND superfamily exporter protein